MVLSFILVQNRQGKTRLAKWYAPYTDEEKVKLKGEVSRFSSYCSLSIFGSESLMERAHTESHGSTGPSPHRPPRPEVPVQLCRVSLRAHLNFNFSPRPASCATESVLYQDRLQTLCRPLLLRLRRRQRQRARVPRSHPLLCRGPRSILRECL